MSNKNCPCRECVPPKREIGCHGKCPEYITWNEGHLIFKRTADAEKLCDSICVDYAIKVTEKNAKMGRIMEKYR